MAFDLPKRLFFGRPLRSDALGHTLLPKKLALPIFSSDALSSVSYATEEILLVLALGGAAFLDHTPWVAAAVVALFAVVVASYRQTVREYPSGGGDYIVAHENLGQTPGLIAASALLIDYVLTVSVSIAAGVYAIYSAVPDLEEHRVALALGFVAFVSVMNLRGVKESGTFFAIPTYGFIVGIMTMLAVGLVKVLTGGELVAETANDVIHAEHTTVGLAGAFLLARAFSSGCTALTGVEAIANGVPAFKRPQSENAAKTLLMMAVLSFLMFTGITALAIKSGVRVTEHLDHRSVVAQIAAAVLGDGTFGFYYIQAFTAGILILAANTAYQDFPRLASVLAQDRYLPRQLHNRGDRLVFSNGIIFLALFASLLIWAFDARVTKIIQLYIVGVFVSFTLGQAGMVAHWNRTIPNADPADVPRMRRSRLINLFGSVTTGIVLLVVLYSKFSKGAWIVVIAMPVIFLTMRGIHRHYERVAAELRLASTRPVLPSRNHAIVLVSQLHNPTLRALNYAKSIKPHTLEAVYVDVDPADTRRLQEDWERGNIDVTLKVLDSPYREITKPFLDYLRKLHRESPRDVVTVVIPEYVVGKWWEQLLHNQSALRLKAFLLFQPNVMVTSVPWHLSTAPAPEEPTDPSAGGAPAGLPPSGGVSTTER